MAEEITGMEDFLKSLEKLPLYVQEKLTATAVRAALKPVQESAVASAPVRSGKLKGEIKISIDKSDPSNVRGNLGYTRKGFYGRFQSGQSKRSLQDQFRGILSAWDRSRDKMLEVLGRRLGSGIEREFRRLNR